MCVSLRVYFPNYSGLDICSENLWHLVSRILAAIANFSVGHNVLQCYAAVHSILIPVWHFMTEMMASIPDIIIEWNYPGSGARSNSSPSYCQPIQQNDEKLLFHSNFHQYE